MARSWRVVGAFHNVGEVAVIVTAPNWQGAIRKGALAIKGLPQLKGRRITVGSFSIQEVETLPKVADPKQLDLVAASRGLIETPAVDGPLSPTVATSNQKASETVSSNPEAEPGSTD